MAEFGTDVVEDLQLMDLRLKQLKNEYEQYFLGSRQREPAMSRSELQRMMNVYSNRRIQNTGQRFKFNNLRARFFSFRRHWDNTLRKIEEGTYQRHVFKAKLKTREEQEVGGQRALGRTAAASHAGADALFDSYLEARRACGQEVQGVTREALSRLLAKQEAQIRKQHSCERVSFRVVVEDGRAKLKARVASSGR